MPDILDVQPRAYRLWSARVTQVSAAPPGWSKELPDNWGTRDQFGDYQPLPEAPSFLQAGLLGDGRSDRPFWFRAPDSVLVLHHDKLGSAGRLRLARIAGPAGRIVWDSGLPLASLQAVTSGERTLVIVGTEPNPAYDPGSKRSRGTHEKIVSVDIASGGISTFDLTAESVRDEDSPSASARVPGSAMPARQRRRPSSAARWPVGGIHHGADVVHPLLETGARPRALPTAGAERGSSVQAK